MDREKCRNQLKFLQDTFDIIYLLDNLRMGAYVVDRDLRILYWNKKAMEITGYNPYEVVGSRCQDDILKHEDRHGVPLCGNEICPLTRSIRTAKPNHVPFALYCKTNTQKKLSLDVSCIPLVMDNHVYGAVELFQHGPQMHFEHENARELQKALIPQNLPSHAQLLYHPALEVGGDMLFYSDPWYVLYDVAGHGTSAAMIATSVLTLLQKIFNDDFQDEELGNLLEKGFEGMNVMDMYFTALVMKKEGHKLRIKSFGHLNPLVISERGEIREIPITYDYPIGFQLPHHTEFTEVQVEPGSRFLSFTDGVFQYCEEYGASREDIYKSFRSYRDVTDIYCAIQRSCPVQEQIDDITLLQISY